MTEETEAGAEVVADTSTILTTDATPAEPAPDAETPPETPTDGQAEPGDGEGQESPPEPWADFALPEGVDVDAATLDGFKDVARELGLSQDAAQRLLSFEAERIRSLNEAAAAKHLEQVDAWASTARADRDYGGEAFEQNVAVARGAVERFAPEPVKELLDQTGLGSHPEIIRMFWTIGRAIRPDGIVLGGDGGGVPDDPEARAQRFYALNKASKPAAK